MDFNVGTWIRKHSEQGGMYEVDFYAFLGLGFDSGVALGTSYTFYASPKDSFTYVKELSVSLSVDDSEYLGNRALNPYVLFTFEMGAGALDVPCRWG